MSLPITTTKAATHLEADLDDDEKSGNGEETRKWLYLACIANLVPSAA